MVDMSGAPEQNYFILRNSLYNVAGWAVPVVVNFVSVPIIVHKLGYDAYGVWTLVMAVMGYFTLLDMGGVKGGIRYLAEFNAKGDADQASAIVSLGLFAYLCIGLFGGLILFTITDPVLLKLIKLPDELRPLARQVFHFAALGFLLTMLQTYLLSLPQAVHRFDISTKVDSFFQVLNTAATIIALNQGHGLLSVIILRIASTALCCVAIVWLMRRCQPSWRLTRKIPLHLARKIFSYSLTSFAGRIGIMTANQLQVLVVGSILGAASVTVFSIPFQLISRVMGISSRLSMLIFPISSELSGTDRLDRLHEIYLSMSRMLFFLSMAQTLMFGLLAWDILAIWMGTAFASQASEILILVAIGYFADTTTNLPTQVCDGLTSPKLTSMFAFVRGCTSIVFALVGGSVAGVYGVAVGFAASCIIMSLVFNMFVHSRVIGLSYGLVIIRTQAESLAFGIGLALVALPFTLLKGKTSPDLVRFFLTAGALAVSLCVYGYLRICSRGQRQQIRAMLAGILRLKKRDTVDRR
ncbi:MAG: polysaccharide biosynthesis [Desulfovibrionaceae bacterium]|nr:MAG: polysaccharide biosynthesis [Desulfovibrionaceae bacterium]